jgi:hypothetical protein
VVLRAFAKSRTKMEPHRAQFQSTIERAEATQRRELRLADACCLGTKSVRAPRSFDCPSLLVLRKENFRS